MLNKFPLWKNLMVIVIIAVASLYAIPNIYGEDYAVQISATRTVTVNDKTLTQVEQTLSELGVQAKGIAFENNQ